MKLVRGNPDPNRSIAPRQNRPPIFLSFCGKVVGAKAEEVLGERARELHVPQAQWTEDLLEGHEQFVKDLRGLGDQAGPILEKIKKREELVQVRRGRTLHGHGVAGGGWRWCWW